jgi:hypothetical protein
MNKSASIALRKEPSVRHSATGSCMNYSIKSEQRHIDMYRFYQMVDVIAAIVVVALLSTFVDRQRYSITSAYTTTTNQLGNRYIYNTRHRHVSLGILYAVKVKQSRSSKQKDLTTTVDDETPAGIVGAQFFGGNKEKEIFYDPVAEMEAGIIMEPTTSTTTTYDRFSDRRAFPDTSIASVAESIQDQINHVLYGDETIRTSIPVKYSYSPNLKWDAIFPKTASSTTATKNATPLQELEAALYFYRRLNVAIICGNTVVDSSSLPSSSNTIVQLRWEISVLWPTLWEPRIVLTGTSQLTIETATNQIIQQTDMLDDADLFRSILKQFFPRFWDVYHIGVTPAAEVSPIIPIGKKWNTLLTSNYQLQEIPPRVVVQTSISDSDDRDDNNASILPNHAFTCVIKTMGPEKQFYTPTTGVQVRLIPNNNNNENRRKLQIHWNIPIATEYVSNPILQLPPPMDESNCNDHEFTMDDIETLQPTCQYVYVPRRFIATIPYAGTPQDTDITKVRKQLYDQIIRDGYQPKMDQSSQRPIFFFVMNSIKACYTNEGLGMAVYEWRPQFTKPNEIGIELEII